MISRELIERINTLAQKQRSTGLSADEKAEQAALRQQYLEAIRGQVKNSLDSIRWEEDSPGNKGCSPGCGCHSKH